MNLLEWFYQTLPYCQLFGKRINILGALWFLLMGYVAYWVLRPRYPKCHWIYLYIVALSLPYLQHIITDELLNFSYITMGNPQFFGYASAMDWSWLTYIGMRAKNYITLVTLLPVLAYRKVHISLHVSSVTVIAMVLILFKFFIQAINNFGAYASMTGEARIQMYWLIYPLSYGLYTLLFLSILKLPAIQIRRSGGLTP